MDAEIKAKWIAALRSGEYQQGSGALKIEHHNGTVEHCCLGVLAELHPNPDWVTGEAAHCTLFGCSGYEGYLPPRIRDWAGLTQCEQESLAAMNDDGLSFDEIANEIEATL